MNRLTTRIEGVAAQAWEHEEQHTPAEWIDLLQERLAAYEDTGLEPEEIRKVQEDLKPIPFGRFRDIMEAERDGRVVILPCKITAPIYLIHAEKEPRKPVKYRAIEYHIDHFTIGGTMIPMITACSNDNEWEELIDGTQEGNEFFLSREEVEKALRGGGADA